mgnify:CR=1 FL=1
MVKLIPITAFVYSSIVGVLPRIAASTTTGVEANNDSPFFRSESATTRPLKRRVEVAITVSPFAAISGPIKPVGLKTESTKSKTLSKDVPFHFLALIVLGVEDFYQITKGLLLAVITTLSLS